MNCLDLEQGRGTVDNFSNFQNFNFFFFDIKNFSNKEEDGRNFFSGARKGNANFREVEQREKYLVARNKGARRRQK